MEKVKVSGFDDKNEKGKGSGGREESMYPQNPMTATG